MEMSYRALSLLRGDFAMSEQRFVLPGEEIGTEEEYVAGSGTYVEEARIFATVAGRLTEENHTLSVAGASSLQRLRPGMLVVGRIDNISEPVALAVMESDEESSKGMGGPAPQDGRPSPNPNRYPKSSGYVVLHASFIKRGYVKKVRDEYRIGDLIRGKIVEEKFGEYHISTDDAHCGCIMAFCSACRTPLEKRDTLLQCPACGRRENRHVADDYRLNGS